MKSAQLRRRIDAAVRRNADAGAFLPQDGESAGQGDRGQFISELRYLVDKISGTVSSFLYNHSPRELSKTVSWLFAAHTSAVIALEKSAGQIRAVVNGSAPTGEAWAGLVDAAWNAGIAYGVSLAYGEKAAAGKAATGKRILTPNRAKARSDYATVISRLARMPRSPDGAYERVAKFYKKAEETVRTDVKRVRRERRLKGGTVTSPP